MATEVKVEKIYSLSPMQEGMLYHSLMDEQKETYFQQISFSIQGDFNVDRFSKSVQIMINKHDILRTNFIYHNMDKPRQVVLNHREVQVYREDLSHLSVKKAEKVMESYELQDRKKGFDLKSELLMRFGVFQLEKNHHRIVWSFHHILMDGWSLGIFLKDLFTIYFSSKAEIPEGRPYIEFINGLKKFPQQEADDYWMEYLKGYDDLSTFPRNNRKVISANYQQIQFSLGVEQTSALTNMSKQYQLTTNNVFQAIWAILLQRYSNQDDVVFGSVTSGRSLVEGMENTLGLFINTIPVRVTEFQDSFINLATKLQQQAPISEKFSYCPLYKMQKRHSQQDLFDHIVVFENYPLDEEIQHLWEEQDQGLSIHNVQIFEQTNYPLTLVIHPGKTWNIKMIYDESIFHHSFILQMETHLKRIIESVLSQPKMQVNQIDIWNEEERYSISQKWNGTRKAYPKEKLIQEWFEEQVEKTPDQLAVVYQEESLTYQALNNRANGLAHILREQGIKPNDRVGLLVDRSVDMVIGVLAILKSGGSYVPIDPIYPKERIAYMLEDSGVKWVLSHDSIIKNLSIKLSWIDMEKFDHHYANVTNLQLINQSSNLAYVIYTSGTTGKPKGVMMEHQQLINLLYDQITRDQVPFYKNVLQFSSIGFDVSFQEIFSTLLSGGTLFISSQTLKQDVQKLLQYVDTNDISVVFCPVTYLKAVASFIDDEETVFPSVCQHIIVAGEQLVVPLPIKRMIEQGRICVHNHYGPSETHVVTTYSLDCSQNCLDTPPIGKPIANTKIYILNEKLQPQPEGVAGELFVAGDSVSRGYMNKPSSTEEKFLPSPFIAGERMYRTGDLARYLSDGNIEFLGRKDTQVKIRGYRIELGEIESTILQYHGVKDTTVQYETQLHGEGYLCAYIVWNQSAATDKLRQYLKQRLPSFMIPAFITSVKSIATNANGKVDRSALPKMNLSSLQQEYVEPTTELEIQLTEIWSQILGIEQIGIMDSFFELGGHSLKAIQLVSKIKKKLQTDVTIKAIFENPTIQQLAVYLRHKEYRRFQAIEPASFQSHYPVSSAQKRMFILQQLEPHATHYHMSGMVVLEGKLDHKRLENAFQTVIDRHESLRTSFEILDNEPVQIIHSNIDFHLPLRKGSVEESNQWAADFIQPFDLSNPCLLRAEIFQTTNRKFLLLVDMHHIIADGVSIDILLEELTMVYRGSKLPKLKIQYKDYSVWQQEWMKSEEFLHQEKFWLQYFQGDIPLLELPTDFNRPEIQTYKGDHLCFTFNEEQTQAIKQLAVRTGTTSFIILFTAYNILLSKYTRQMDVVVGTPVLGRSHEDVGSVLGMFVNTLALRNQLKHDERTIDLIQKTKANALSAFDHGDYPFEMLIEKLTLDRDKGRSPLFQVLFSMPHINRDLFQLDGITAQFQEVQRDISKFDLSLFVEEDKNTYRCQFEYNTSLFRSDTIERMMGHYMQIVKQIILQPEIKLDELDMLTPEEKQRIFYTWNDTNVDYPDQQSIVDLFLEQVEKTPTNTALSFKGQEITYLDLDAKVNQFAHFLLQEGIQPEDHIAIILERSPDVIISMLAILKVGAVYVPIDPNYPIEQITYMLKDSHVSLVLSCESLRTKLRVSNQVNWLDVEKCVEADGEVCSYFSPEIQPDSVSYIMYTSGTTGKPKGVEVTHRGVIRLVKGANYTDFREDNVFLQLAPVAFDASTFEIWGSLLHGAKLVIMPDGHPSLEEIAAELKRQKVTTLWLTAGLFKLMVDYQLPSLLGLNQLLVGGDVVSVSHVQRVLAKGNVQVINGYGPTENTTFSCCYAIPQDWNTNEPLPIGRPISNTKVYILDQFGQPAPVGVRGELYVGGAGLARGYHGKPNWTKARFHPSPIASHERLYQTGDLGYYLPDGNIAFCGRVDTQVKVRGHRIELGEIESVLLKQPDVKDIVVCAWKDDRDETYLCAYVIADEKNVIPTLQKVAEQKLPSHMVPAFFLLMDHLPLTSNGKIDRKSLPKPNASTQQREYVPPATKQEKQLARIWQYVLGLGRVGVTDHFFELGGDSIKAIQIAAMLQKENKKLSIHHLFHAPTIQKLIPFLEDVNQQIDQHPVEGKAPLTPIQMEFFNQNGSIIHHFNQSVLLFHKNPIQTSDLHQVFTKLVEHHDALRMNFYQVNGQWFQVNHSMHDAVFQICTVDLRKDKNPLVRMEKWANQIQRSLHTTKGPLMRIGHFNTDEGDYVLWVLHHLVVDGVSWRILVEDFQHVYQQIRKKEHMQLPAKTTSYLDWAKRLHSYATTYKMRKEIPYWEKLEQMELMKLPKDHFISESMMEDSTEVSFTLTKLQTNQLLSEIHHAYQTEINDILLTALGLALKKWTRSNRVGFVLEGHGREDIGEDCVLNRTVGWFTSCFPVLLELTDSDDVGYTIKEVKETLRRIPKRGIGYGILQYLTKREKPSNTPEVRFNYLGQFGQQMENSQFTFSSLPSGQLQNPKMKRTYTLELNAVVVNDTFTLNLQYSNKEYKQETILAFLDLFQHQLKSIMSHCLQQSKTQRTPSDLGNVNLSLQDLQYIEEIFSLKGEM
jgi:amino acid adenylation domain-containing protein/non-ribosomal peptide synthase protein (TIGR01720 family)